MTLTDLHTFSIVAKMESISAAGRIMNLPKSTISRRIKRLEERLDVALFLRTAKQIVLTQDGQAFYKQIATHIDQLLESQQMLKDRDGEPKGLLRITTTEGYAQTDPVLGCLSSYIERYPNVQIELILTTQLARLVEDKIDIGLRLYTGNLPGDSATMSRHLHRISAGIFASKEYIQRKGIPTKPNDIMNHDVVNFSKVSFEDKPWLYQGKIFKERIPFPKAKMLVDTHSTLLHFALAGMGLCILSTAYAAPFVKRGKLVRVLEDLEQKEGKVSIVWVSSAHLSNKVRSFIDHAVQHLAGNDI